VCEGEREGGKMCVRVCVGERKRGKVFVCDTQPGDEMRHGYSVCVCVCVCVYACVCVGDTARR